MQTVEGRDKSAKRHHYLGPDAVGNQAVGSVGEGLAAAGTTILVSSHVMDEADHCDTLLLMRDGRLLGSETPAGLRERTGKDQLEDAFLALIEQTEGG